MSECREHKPLLREPWSDEEVRVHPRDPRDPRRHAGARARGRVKGAAAIIASWPDHWSTISHCWIALGVLSLVTMLIYNAIIAFAVFPAAYSRIKTYAKFQQYVNADKLPDITIPIFVNDDRDLYYLKYLPYIEVIAEKYTEFKFNVLLVNPNIHNSNNNSEKSANDAAMDNILSQNSHYDYVHVQKVSLHQLMDNSPLNETWHLIHPKFYPFFVRAISIWETGGIAFNPIILTPNSPRLIYIDKLQNIFERYSKRNHGQEKKEKKAKLMSKMATLGMSTPRRRVNNIRDVIEALEDNDSMKSNYSQHNLTGVESKLLEKIYNGRKLMSVEGVNTTKSSLKTSVTEIIDSEKYERKTSDARSISTKSKILDSFNPLFDLFHEMINSNYANNSVIEQQDMDKNGAVRKPIVDYDSKLSKFDYAVVDKMSTEKILTMLDINSLLTIDLEGNLLATNIPCHAFLGTIFSNVKNYYKEPITVADFVVAELSIFCKGIFSSCKGLDVMFL